jgi:hypothetical protein
MGSRVLAKLLSVQIPLTAQLHASAQAKQLLTLDLKQLYHHTPRRYLHPAHSKLVVAENNTQAHGITRRQLSLPKSIL